MAIKKSPTSLVLASSSPRRQELLKSVGFELMIVHPKIDEALIAGERPDDAVLRLAQKKIANIQHQSDVPSLAADTLVALDEEILGKPSDDKDAVSMLKRLSGKVHHVYTGFAVQQNSRSFSAFVKTQVSFRTLTRSEIDAYVSTKEPLDKAGAYAIQGHGASLIDEIHGSFSNVVGLPLKEVLFALEQIRSSPCD